MGTELKQAIERMGLNPNKFAKICIKANGKALSQSAIVDLIQRPHRKPEPDTVEAIERALSKICPHCEQYWEGKKKRRS